MSKHKVFANPAFQTQVQKAINTGFNLAPQVNNFNAVFDTQPLDEKESRKLEKLLVDNFLPGKISEKQVEIDIVHLREITAEIKAISKQGIVLMGERIHKAKMLLKPYKDGTFTHWLETTFGSRRTAYNMLSYYQLYSELPDYSLKEKFKKIPPKIAYILASKNVRLEEKAKIIDDYHDLNSDELMMLIQDKFPTDENDGRRKEANKTLLDSLETGFKKLMRRKDQLTEDNLAQLIRIRKLMDEILKEKHF